MKQIKADGINTLTHTIIAISFDIQNILGNSLKEIYYQRALSSELTNLGIKHECEKEFILKYKDSIIGKHRLDLLVEKKLVLELKTIPLLTSKDKQQLFMYLRSLKIKWGLLINFRSTKVQIKRIVLPDKYLS